MAKAQKSKGLVVLLHGILRSKFDMLALERALKKQGYDTANIVYPASSARLEDLSALVGKEIENHPDFAADKPLYFVTHSMGGLIARYYIASRKPTNLAKVVMLSPPNTGSELADFFDNNNFLSGAFRALFGPASGQLKTTYKHEIGEITYPLGVIAGNLSVNPLGHWLLPHDTVGPHDGIVPVERTKIEGMADHITLPATHMFMMFNPDVIAQVSYFLEHGKFNHDVLKPEAGHGPEMAL